MKTKKIQVTSLCYAIVLGNNRGLELYYRNELISRYPSISNFGGLKSIIAEAKKEAYQEVNHSRKYLFKSINN